MSASGSRAWSARCASCARPTRSCGLRACISRRNSIRPDRSESLHRRAPLSLRGRVHLPDPGRVGVRVLPARHRRALRRQVEDERLLEGIRETQAANYEAYGYRRTWKALLRAGEQVPRCQVQRLMRQAGIQGAKRRGKPWQTTVADPNAARPADLVERDFTASRPDELSVCDFTRLRCWDGVVYI